MKHFFYLGLVFVMFFFLFGCSFETPPDVKLVNEIRKATAKKLEEQKNLYLIGTGSQMMDEIEMLAMSFNYYHEVDLKLARELVISAVDEFLMEINDKKEIRPYLSNYPFTAKNIEIAIFFRNPDGSNVAAEKINIAAANQGKVIYYIDCPEKHTIKAIYRETYEKAKEAIFSK